MYYVKDRPHRYRSRPTTTASSSVCVCVYPSLWAGIHRSGGFRRTPPAPAGCADTDPPPAASSSLLPHSTASAPEPHGSQTLPNVCVWVCVREEIMSYREARSITVFDIKYVPDLMSRYQVNMKVAQKALFLISSAFKHVIFRFNMFAYYHLTFLLKQCQ